MLLRYSLFFACVVFLSACATPFTSIPKTDEDFQLPSKEFVEKFEDIKTYQIETKRGSAPGKYQQLVDSWGDPDDIKVDKEFTYTQLGWLSVLTGAVFVDLPAVWAGTVGLVAVIAPPSPEIHTWNKGDYRVEARTRSSAATKHERVVDYWDWKVKQNNEFVPLIPKDQRKLHGLFRFRFARGFDDIGDTDVSDPGGGSGLHLELGIEYENVFQKTDLVLVYGYKTDTLVDHYDSSKKIKVTSYPIQLSALYNLDDRWRLGGGLNYISNTLLDYNYKEDESPDDALGFVVQADFNAFRQQRIGVAIEYAEQELANGDKFNSSNFNAYSTLIFW